MKESEGAVGGMVIGSQYFLSARYGIIVLGRMNDLFFIHSSSIVSATCLRVSNRAKYMRAMIARIEALGKPGIGQITPALAAVS